MDEELVPLVDKVINALYALAQLAEVGCRGVQVSTVYGCCNCHPLAERVHPGAWLRDFHERLEG
jgi:hypothetical protein